MVHIAFVWGLYYPYHLLPDPRIIYWNTQLLRHQTSILVINKFAIKVAVHGWISMRRCQSMRTLWICTWTWGISCGWLLPSWVTRILRCLSSRGSCLLKRLKFTFHYWRKGKTSYHKISRQDSGDITLEALGVAPFNPLNVPLSIHQLVNFSGITTDCDFEDSGLLKRSSFSKKIQYIIPGDPDISPPNITG